MKNKSGGKDGRINNWLETADDEFEQEFYGGEPAGPEEGDEFSFDQEDSQFDIEDDRELEEPEKNKKKWILMGMVAVCLVALAAFLFSDRFYNMIQGRSSYTLEKMDQTVSFAEGNTTVVYTGKICLDAVRMACRHSVKPVRWSGIFRLRCLLRICWKQAIIFR